MTENYSGNPSGGEQDPLRFWIEQIAASMGAGRTPDTPPPQNSMEHQLYDALMKEVVYGVPYNNYYVVEPGGRTRYTDPGSGEPLSPGEIPHSIAEAPRLREGINHIGMEGQRLRVTHITHNFGPGQTLENSGTDFERLASRLGRKGGVLYIDPPLQELAGEAKANGLSINASDALQTMLNTVAVRVHYGFLTDAHTVGRIDDEIKEILPVISEQMGPSMRYLAEQIRGTGVEVRLLGMDGLSAPDLLVKDLRMEKQEALEEEGSKLALRLKDLRLALSLRNYAEWLLLGEMGADLAERAQQKHRVRDAAILTSDSYANLGGKLGDRGTSVTAVGVLSASRLQLCGQRGYIDPIDFQQIFPQEQYPAQA